MKKIYCLSGLGVDHRAFRNIKIDGVELVHIPWIDPIKNETLSAYARRLFDSANIPKEYNLMGVSFGGMIAQEFEKIQKPEHLFLISSISDRSQLSAIFKLGGRLKLYKVVPRFVVTRFNWLMNPLFGVKSKEGKRLFKEILVDTNLAFFRWAMGAIVGWKNTAVSQGIRIHGTRDRILPMRGKPDHVLPKSGHFMILTHGKEVSKIIEKRLFAMED